MPMIYKSFGRSTTKVSAIGLGFNIGGDFYRKPDFNALARVLDEGIERGLNLVDTAPAYGNGASEEVLGAAMVGRRNRFFVSTKINPENATKEKTIQSVHESLKRLRTDEIDLIQPHWPNPQVSLEESFLALEELAQQGKVRFIGACNLSSRQLKRAASVLTVNPLACNQVEYNLFDRSIEDAVLPYCEMDSISILAYSPLHRGRIANGKPALDLLDRLGLQYGKRPPQIALNWLVSHTQVFAIPSTVNVERLRENLESLDFKLNSDDIELINRVCVGNLITVPTTRIRVVSDWAHAAYKTLEEASSNYLNMTPSPQALAEELRAGEFLKPVRIRRLPQSENGIEYELIEGRTRYWAWVIAKGESLPIPCLVDESQ